MSPRGMPSSRTAGTHLNAGRSVPEASIQRFDAVRGKSVANEPTTENRLLATLMPTQRLRLVTLKVVPNTRTPR